MQYKCDKCDKYFTSKKKKTDHERRAHPATEQPNKPATLEVKPPAKKTKEKPATGYHCVDCGASVSKGQDHCPSCGAHLDWSQIS